MAVSMTSQVARDRPPALKPGSSPIHVLLVTGDRRRIAPWVEALHRGHFSVAIATSDHGARALLAAHDQDIVLLDLGDPAIDGVALCRQLRAAGHTVPVLMLHPSGTLEDLITGIEAGADAYMRGWFEPVELLAYLGALCRRHVLGKQLGASSREYAS